jgi:hypothetical protein
MKYDYRIEIKLASIEPELLIKFKLHGCFYILLNNIHGENHKRELWFEAPKLIRTLEKLVRRIGEFRL